MGAETPSRSVSSDLVEPFIPALFVAIYASPHPTASGRLWPGGWHCLVFGSKDKP